MFEELSASLIYIAGILNLKHTLTGATNIVFFLGNAAWQFLLGPFLPSIRALSGLVGAVGILFLYLGLKRLTDRNSALLASGMAAMSVYGSYFSRVAVETGWPLTFFSINLYLYSHLTGKKKNFFTIFLLGLSTVMGVFTYPGYTLWLVAISPFLFFQFAKTRNFRMILPYAAGILIFFIPATFSKLQIG